LEILIRLFSGNHLAYDYTTFGKIVSVLKSVRIFRVLFFSEVLEPLNFMIEAFVKTFM
jgi:hypothetical protein